MTNFPAEFSHLQTEDFGDQKKVTEEMLEAFAKNDEYFYQKVIELLDLSDPETTQHFYPPNFMDATKSFGINQRTITKDNKQIPIYECSDITEKMVKVDFGLSSEDNDTWIDYDSSDVKIINDGSSNYGVMIQDIIETIVVPKTTTTTTQKTIKDGKEIKNAWNNGAYGSLTSPNGHFYIGFDIDKNYNVKSAWKTNPHSTDIPSVCRAMTFKATRDGLITKVNIPLMTDAKTNGQMYVEIRETTKQDGYYVPTSKVLARSNLKFTHKSNTVKTFTFNKQASVKSGQIYAVVMKAPLCSQYNTYRLCGWQSTCYKTWKAFQNTTNATNSGYNFLSKNNGKTWKRLFNASGTINYKTGAHTPIAIGFEVYIQPTKISTTTKTITIDEIEYYDYYPVGNHEVFFKLPTTNPITRLTISASTQSSTTEGTSIHWYVSKNNREWKTNTTASGEGEYDIESIFGEKPIFLWVKAVLSTTNGNYTPSIQDVAFNVKTEYAKNSYLRTQEYEPVQEHMLGACIWSEVDSTIENYNANVQVDLVRGKETTEDIELLNVSVENLQPLIRELDPTQPLSDIDTVPKILEYIGKTPLFLDYLKGLTKPIYILPYTDDDGKDYNFFEKIELHDYPAYPILGMNIEADDLILEAADCAKWDYTTYTTPIYTFEEGIINNDLNEINLSKITDDGVETFKLFEGNDFTNKIDSDNTRYADYQIIRNEGKITGIKFNLNNSEFKNECNIDTTTHKITSFKNNFENLNICLNNTEYSEWLDYTIGENEGDYSTKEIVWQKDGLGLIRGDLKITYNPIFARNIPLPLKLDLWTESFTTSEQLKTYELRGYPVDELRTIYENNNIDDELIENRDFSVDYLTKTITFNTTIEAGTPITIKYTPNLTDDGLSLAYRINRENDTQNCYILDESYTTRT